MMRLILIRHGDAHAGFHGVIGGVKGCAGLTDAGRQQAITLRDHLAETDRLRPDVVITSVLPRAIETAQLIVPALGRDIDEHDCDLCEVHPGEADGLTWVEYERRYGSFDMEAEPDREFAPGGDSWNGFHERVRGALERLAQHHAGRTVIVVCHAGVVTASMRLLLGIDPGNGTQIRPTNTGLTEWAHDADKERWTLHSFNDAGHLHGVPVRASSDDPGLAP